MLRHQSLAAVLGLLAACVVACDESVTLDDIKNATALHETKEGALQSLRQADEAWDRSTVAVDSFVSFFTDDALWLFVNGPRMSGRDEIRAFATIGWERPAFVLDWEAISAGVNDTYDVGYTGGNWRSSYDGEDGHAVEGVGSYIAIWKRTESGEWKVAIEVELPGQGVFEEGSEIRGTSHDDSTEVPPEG